MRLFYTLFLYLAAPVAFAVQLGRGFRNRAYWKRASERFGFVPRSREPTLWVHAVSVGEVRAAAILIPQLKARWPTLPIVVTTTTPTGAKQVRDLFGDTVRHCYLPFDLPGAVRRFVDRVQPRAGVIMETELWPNLFLACGRRGIPLTIASARLSARSVSGYRRLRGLLIKVFAGDITVAAQTAADAARYRDVGSSAPRTVVAGNVKFDLAVPADIPLQGKSAP